MSDSKRPRLVQCRVKINDGFTMSDTYRAGEPIVYSGVAISYRPALQVESADFIDDPRKFIIKARELVVKHVTGWNVANDKGDDVAPVTPETVAELAYPVLSWMVNCVTGYAPREEGEDAKN